MELSKNEQKVLEILREPVEFQTITIKKAKYGKIKRITVHTEDDVILEETV